MDWDQLREILGLQPQAYRDVATDYVRTGVHLNMTIGIEDSDQERLVFWQDHVVMLRGRMLESEDVEFRAALLRLIGYAEERVVEIMRRKMQGAPDLSKFTTTWTNTLIPQTSK